MEKSADEEEEEEEYEKKVSWVREDVKAAFREGEGGRWGK